MYLRHGYHIFSGYDPILDAVNDIPHIAVLHWKLLRVLQLDYSTQKLITFWNFLMLHFLVEEFLVKKNKIRERHVIA